MSLLKMYTLGPKDVICKTRQVTRSMTTATAIAKLPRGSRVLMLILNGTASNAGTTATLSFGTSTTATEWVNAANALAAGVGNGTQVLNGVAGALGGGLPASSQAPTATNDILVYAKYAETGTASSAGGWTLTIVYTAGETTR